MKQRNGRIESVDTLRGIIILAIVLFHMPPEIRVDIPVINFFYKYGGVLGNTFFFVTSGFFITYIYYDKVENNSFFLFDFIKKRVGKIYVTYLITSVISAIYSVFNNGIESVNGKTVLLNAVMMTSGWVEDIYPFNVPCWFFSALIIQYCLWFLVVKFKRGYSDYFFGGLVLLGLSIIYKPLGPFLWHHTGEAMAPFFWGCLLERVSFRRTDSCMQKLCICLLACTGLVVSYSKCTGYDMTTLDAWYVWVFIISTAILLNAIYMWPLKGMLENKALNFFFGDISTYIFLWHFPFNFLFLLITRGKLSQNSITLFLLY